MEDAQDQACLTVINTARGPIMRGVLGGVVLAGFLWLMLNGPLRVVAALLALGLTPLINAATNRPEALWLDGDHLVHDLGGKRTCLDLSQPVVVSRDFIPKKGDDLVLRDRAGHEIRIWNLGPDTEDLRRRIGSYPTIRAEGTGVLDEKTKALLLRDR